MAPRGLYRVAQVPKPARPRAPCANVAPFPGKRVPRPRAKTRGAREGWLTAPRRSFLQRGLFGHPTLASFPALGFQGALQLNPALALATDDRLHFIALGVDPDLALALHPEVECPHDTHGGIERQVAQGRE